MSPTVKKGVPRVTCYTEVFHLCSSLKIRNNSSVFFCVLFFTFMGLTVFELIYKLSLSLSNVSQGLDSSCASSRAGIPS